MFLRIIIGITITLIGGLLTIKANWFYENFGSVAWAEKFLGTEGGSRLFYKLIGILAVFIGLLLISGLYESFMRAVIGFIFGGLGKK